MMVVVVRVWLLFIGQLIFGGHTKVSVSVRTMYSFLYRREDCLSMASLNLAVVVLWKRRGEIRERGKDCVLVFDIHQTKEMEFICWVHDKIGRKEYVRMSAKINKIKRVSQREIWIMWTRRFCPVPCLIQDLSSSLMSHSVTWQDSSSSSRRPAVKRRNWIRIIPEINLDD